MCVCRALQSTSIVQTITMPGRRCYFSVDRIKAMICSSFTRFILFQVAQRQSVRCRNVRNLVVFGTNIHVHFTRGRKRRKIVPKQKKHERMSAFKTRAPRHIKNKLCEQAGPRSSDCFEHTWCEGTAGLPFLLICKTAQSQIWQLNQICAKQTELSKILWIWYAMKCLSVKSCWICLLSGYFQV